MTVRWRWRIAVAGLVALTGAGLAEAKISMRRIVEEQRLQHVQAQKAVSQAPVERQVGAQKVSIDPATGSLLEPTPEQAMQLEKELERMLSQDLEGLEVVELPDGTLMLDLQDRFNEVALATIAPDGSVTLSCVEEPVRAISILRSAAAQRLGRGAAPAAAEVK